MSAIIVITNVPDREVAQKIAHTLVERRLAACVNILAECTAVYRWQGALETAGEVPLLIKTAPLRTSGNRRGLCRARLGRLPRMAERGDRDRDRLNPQCLND